MSNRRQRVSIESCFLENKRITIVITKKAALKTVDPNRFCFDAPYTRLVEK